MHKTEKHTSRTYPISLKSFLFFCKFGLAVLGFCCLIHDVQKDILVENCPTLCKETDMINIYMV